jgi:hypothetical protein
MPIAKNASRLASLKYCFLCGVSTAGNGFYHGNDQGNKPFPDRPVWLSERMGGINGDEIGTGMFGSLATDDCGHGIPPDPPYGTSDDRPPCDVSLGLDGDQAYPSLVHPTVGGRFFCF